MIEPNRTYSILIAAPGLTQSGLDATLKQENNYQIFNSKTVQEAARLVETENIDLVLIEKSLPGLDILDLVIKVRSNDPDIPILLLIDEQDTEVNQKFWSYGIDDCIKFPFSTVELTHRIARSLKMRRLSSLFATLQVENRELRQLSQTDGLTQLKNRRHFNEVIISEYARAKRYGGDLGCLMIDIDHFKAVNDTYGHLTGDRILQDLAKIFTRNVRSIDIVARYGGEEFVLLLPETGVNGMSVVAEKLRHAVEKRDFRKSGNSDEAGPERVTISIGYAIFPGTGVLNSEDLLKHADEALYYAKETGRNRAAQWSLEIGKKTEDGSI